MEYIFYAAKGFQPVCDLADELFLNAFLVHPCYPFQLIELYDQQILGHCLPLTFDKDLSEICHVETVSIRVEICQRVAQFEIYDICADYDSETHKHHIGSECTDDDPQYHDRICYQDRNDPVVYGSSAVVYYTAGIKNTYTGYKSHKRHIKCCFLH